MTKSLRLIYISFVLAFLTLTLTPAVAGIFPPYNEAGVFSAPEEESKFTLYINEGFLNIKYDKPNELANGEVFIYNLLGQEIARKKLETIAINQISIPNQNTCFIVRINYSGKVYTQKIVVSGL
jgi:hypothetical protein